MAYTNTWNEATPTDNDLASSIDDIFRSLKLDIHERMDVLVEDWSADPVVPKQSAFGAKTSKKLIVHGTAFIIEPATSDSFNYDDTGITNNSNTNQPCRAWVPLPHGVTITQIRWISTNGDTAPVTLSFRSLAFDIGLAVEIINSMSNITNGVSINDSGPISVTTDANTKSYFLEADKGGGALFGIQACEITYDTPDSTATI